MISRRNYIAAVMLMGVLMFLLMGSNVLKDWWNDYSDNRSTGDVNEHAFEPNPEWYNDDGRSTAGSVVFLGDSSSGCRRATQDWAAYSRRDYREFRNLRTYRNDAKADVEPRMLVIDAASMDWTAKGDAEYLADCAGQGTDLVFCTLPDTDVVRNNETLRDLLGIRGVAKERQPADGLFLYPGFLLGGAKLYLPEPKTESKTPTKSKATMDVVFPGDVNAAGKPVFAWYQLGPGTKVYMSGYPTDSSIQRQNYPPLIWRRSLGEAYVFAVNGGYFDGAEGMGLLAAMVAEASRYQLYPVVNAQNLVLIDYPVLADENSAQMQRLYSREATAVYQELIWPNIRQAVQKYGYKASCMMAPQLDYSDENLADAKQLDFYLKIFNEASAETGLSLTERSGVSVERKVESDEQFFADALDYNFSSVYAGDIPDSEVDLALQSALLSSVVTVVNEYSDDTKIVTLLNENVTRQGAVDTEFKCTHKQDFLLRCLQTALGYTSIAYDMSRVAFPESERDQWEKLSVDFGASIDAYGRMFPELERTTVSESGSRIRAFLATRYSESREGNEIRIRTEGANDAQWFFLRVHDEMVERIDGGTFAEIESGTYLIEANESDVLIHVAPKRGISE